MRLSLCHVLFLFSPCYMEYRHEMCGGFCFYVVKTNKLKIALTSAEQKGVTHVYMLYDCENATDLTFA